MLLLSPYYFKRRLWWSEHAPSRISFYLVGGGSAPLSRGGRAAGCSTSSRFWVHRRRRCSSGALSPSSSSAGCRPGRTSWSRASSPTTGSAGSPPLKGIVHNWMRHGDASNMFAKLATAHALARAYTITHTGEHLPGLGLQEEGGIFGLEKVPPGDENLLEPMQDQTKNAPRAIR